MLLAARELVKTPPTRNFDWWNIDEGDKRAIAALEKKRFRGPMDLYVLPNPHDSDSAPMKLMKDKHVKGVAEVLLGPEEVRKRESSYTRIYGERQPYRPTGGATKPKRRRVDEVSDDEPIVLVDDFHPPKRTRIDERLE